MPILGLVIKEMSFPYGRAQLCNFISNVDGFCLCKLECKYLLS